MSGAQKGRYCRIIGEIFNSILAETYRKVKKELLNNLMALLNLEYRILKGQQNDAVEVLKFLLEKIEEETPKKVSELIELRWVTKCRCS